MPSIQQLILATIAALATMAAAAPGTPPPKQYPPPFVGSWDDPQGLGIFARAPSATTAVAAAATETFTVGCGCWNICTLQKVANNDLVCPEVCDPLFQCPIDPSVANAKRDVDALGKRQTTVTTTGGSGTTVVVIITKQAA